MNKHYFYAIDNGEDPTKLYRFPTMRARQKWIDDGINREAVEQKSNHWAYWQVRRINRMVQAGHKVEFPFALEG